MDRQPVAHKRVAGFELGSGGDQGGPEKRRRMMRHIVVRDFEIDAVPAKVEDLVQRGPAVVVPGLDKLAIVSIPDPENAEPRLLSGTDLPGQGYIRHEAAEPDIGKPEPSARFDLERCVGGRRSRSVRRLTDPDAGEEPFRREADRDERPAQKALMLEAVAATPLGEQFSID